MAILQLLVLVRPSNVNVAGVRQSISRKFRQHRAKLKITEDTNQKRSLGRGKCALGPVNEARNRCEKTRFGPILRRDRSLRSCRARRKEQSQEDYQACHIAAMPPKPRMAYRNLSLRYGLSVARQYEIHRGSPTFWGKPEATPLHGDLFRRLRV